jgi:3',5'-cyclic AMP phosphodiesterase CpdA
MTRLWIFSDLHFEQGNNFPPPAPDHDVCVIPGDLNHLPWAIESLQSRELGNGVTLYVPGNHDYYQQESMEGAERLAEQNVKRSNVFIANPAEYVFDRTRFLGCTMWTDYQLYGNPMAAMGHAGNGMMDHHLIKTEDGAAPGATVRFMPDHSLKRHKRELAWLESRLAEGFDGPTVIVTHHSPSPRSVPDRFDGDPLTPAFSSNLEWLIEKYQPALWIHGHTHDSFDYMIGKTRIVCNPAGYQHEPNPDFRWDLVIDVEDYEPTPTMGM